MDPSLHALHAPIGVVTKENAKQVHHQMMQQTDREVAQLHAVGNHAEAYEAYIRGRDKANTLLFTFFPRVPSAKPQFKLPGDFTKRMGKTRRPDFSAKPNLPQTPDAVWSREQNEAYKAYVEHRERARADSDRDSELAESLSKLKFMPGGTRRRR